jgi:hypothetical protein
MTMGNPPDGFTFQKHRGRTLNYAKSAELQRYSRLPQTPKTKSYLVLQVRSFSSNLDNAEHQDELSFNGFLPHKVQLLKNLLNRTR